jgi:alanyl-tRNA synthetase
LASQADRIAAILKAEEERFYETLEIGMQILDEALGVSSAAGVTGVTDPKAPNDQSKKLSGEVAFKLHDTYGFPLDLTNDVCRERGVTVDEAGFHAAMG